MGNYRFRLSDMIPNAWFYKLRDMSKTRSTQNPNSHKKLPFPSQKPNKSSSPPESSAKNILTSFDHTHSYNPPRQSFKKWAKRRTVYVPSPKKITPASVCTVFQEPTSNLDHGFLNPNLPGLFQDTDEYSFHGPNYDQAMWSTTESCKLTSYATDIVIDVNKSSKESDFNMILEPKLPPILTKPKRPDPGLENQNRLPSKKTRSTGASTGRKSVSRRSGGVRINQAAKLGSKKGESRSRKSMKVERKEMYNAERFAIVKSSFDPERDFRESMMEMIVENNIRASKELEDLLACYLSLNSNHYHHIIIKAFQQIWFNLPQ